MTEADAAVPDARAEPYEDAVAALRATAVPAAPLVLHAVYGINPSDTATLLDLAAMALTHHAWRNTAIEDAHSQGAIDDADQIVSNIDAWRIVRSRTGDHPSCWMPYPPDTAKALADAHRIVAGRTLTSRLRGTGVRTRDLRQDIGRRLWARSSLVSVLGGSAALPLFALSGAVTCDHWFGTPWWPRRCALFWQTLPVAAAHEHPQIAAAARRLLAEPRQVGQVIAALDLLDHQTRDDLILTGLRYVQVPHDTDAAKRVAHAKDAFAAAAVLGM